MVTFPWKRGEAVHACFDRHLVLLSGQEGASTTATKGAHSPVLEPSDRSSAVGGGRQRCRDSAVVGHLAKHVGELEAALAEQEALWTGRCTPRRAAGANDPQASASVAARCAAGPAPYGVRLYAMDGSSARRVLGSANGGIDNPCLDQRTASPERFRMEADETHHTKSAESVGHRKGLESTPEAKKGALDTRAEYELWFADGVRFELLPVTVYTYRKRGQPLLIPTPGKNAKVAVCGAMRWPDGPFIFADGSGYPNTSLFIRMLQELRARARRTGKRIVLVLDNGSAHTSRRSQAEIERSKDVIHIFWLPTYTSEQLNDIEGLWKHLKEDYFSRMLVAKSVGFREAVVKLLKRMRRGKGLRRVLKPCVVNPVHKNLLVPA